MRQRLGMALNSAAVPGAIAPVEIYDKLTDQCLSVTVGELFVCLSVDGRDYYFDRITGRFGGTGPNFD